MELYTKYPQPRGTMLVIANGFRGEEDFNKISNMITEVINPDDQGYSVDSMCIGGYFVKDGIRVRTSSESPYDDCSFFYDPRTMSEEEAARVEQWIAAVLGALKPLE